MFLVCSGHNLVSRCWPLVQTTMRSFAFLCLLSMTACASLTPITDCASLDVALGVHWSSYANQGKIGSYLSSDFASHVVLPLLTRVADAILYERNVNYYQNITLIVLSIIVLAVLTFSTTWLYARRHFLQKMALLVAAQPIHHQPIQPNNRNANDV
jgi:hypothetical protein